MMKQKMKKWLALLMSFLMLFSNMSSSFAGFLTVYNKSVATILEEKDPSDFVVL